MTRDIEKAKGDEPVTIHIAECDAPCGVTLRAYGSDERRARLALARGWRAHYAQLNAAIEPRLNPDDINVRECELDHCYRDGIDFNSKLT